MAMIPPHIVDDIMQTARIEEVIGQFVNLKRAGSNLKGLSPFTDEKTASFVVSPAKQIFKCFSTGKGGNAASFLMEKEHYSYPEALKWLADKYGIQLPEDKPATAEELAAISERESLHIINDFARDHFANNIQQSDEGKKIGLSYFIERGFKPEIIEQFQLGYCLNKSNGFTDAALEKGFKIEYLNKVGLTKTKDDRHFDFFRGRVIFPIHSVTGRILGFGARTLSADKKVAKYFNSPESIIYNKSQILYGLHFAKGDIIKYDNCLLCEGYTDVISMHQAGIKNVVSSSGTSLTKEQIRLVKRYTKNITILYDGDAAGIKASFRGIDLILEEGMNVKVVLFPDGEDPDSFAKASTTPEIEVYIKEHTQDFISFKSDILIETGEEDPIKRAGLIKEIVHSVSLIPDQITRNVYMQSISQRFEMDENILSNELIKLRQNTAVKQQKEQERFQKAQTRQEEDPYAHEPSPFNEEEAQTEISPVKTIDPNEFDLMRILVLYGALELEVEQFNEEGEKENVKTSVSELICHELNEDDLLFENPLFNRIYQIIIDALVENSLLKTTYFKRLDDIEVIQFITEIEMSEHELSANWVAKFKIHTNTEKDKLKQAVMGTIYTFKNSKVENRIKEIRSKLETLGSDITNEQLNDLLSEQVLLEQVKIIISDKLGRVILR